MRRTSLWGRISWGVLFFLLVVGAFRANPSVAHSSQPTREATKTLTATVHAVDTETNTVKVVTGVGHALRIVQVQVDAECEIKVQRAQAQLADLKVGDLVHIEYHKRGDDTVADMIETVEPEGER